MNEKENKPYTLKSFKEAGFTPYQLRRFANFTIKELIEAGFTFNNLTTCFSLQELKDYITKGNDK